MVTHARIWEPEGLAGVQCLRAGWLAARFDRHFHEGYAVGVIEEGALGFRYLGRDELAPAGSVNMVAPGEVHDGHAASPSGWRYRMFYLDAHVAGQALAELTGREGLPDFPGGVVRDPVLASTLRALHQDLDHGSTTLLERQARFSSILSRWITQHGLTRVRACPDTEPAAVRRAEEYLRAHAADPVPLSDLAAACGLSGFRLTRVFSLAKGLPPHAYQIRLRVEAARRLLAGGTSPAVAAAQAGFADQSHLTRHFKRVLGFTPSAYGKIVQDS